MERSSLLSDAAPSCPGWRSAWTVVVWGSRLSDPAREVPSGGGTTRRSASGPDAIRPVQLRSRSARAGRGLLVGPCAHHLDPIVLYIVAPLGLAYLAGCMWMFFTMRGPARALSVVLVLGWSFAVWLTWPARPPRPGDLWQWALAAETAIALVHLVGLWRHRDAIARLQWGRQTPSR